MKISSIQNYQQNFGGLTIELGETGVKAMKRLGDMNSVDQRLIAGVTALALQPAIDMTNKKVDDNTRKSSAARSIAKAIVGTTTGILVRGGFIKLFEKAAEAKKGFIYSEAFDNLNPKQIKEYGGVVGTFAALAFMMVSNFLVDVPLTNKLHLFLRNKMVKEDATTTPQVQTQVSAPAPNIQPQATGEVSK